MATFTPIGRWTFVACANALYAQLADPDCPEVLCGPLAKLEGYGARFALLVHPCRWVWRGPGAVHPFSLAAALDYADRFHQFRREPDGVHKQTEAAMALCSEQRFAYYPAWGTTLQG